MNESWKVFLAAFDWVDLLHPLTDIDGFYDSL